MRFVFLLPLSAALREAPAAPASTPDEAALINIAKHSPAADEAAVEEALTDALAPASLLQERLRGAEEVAAYSNDNAMADAAVATSTDAPTTLSPQSLDDMIEAQIDQAQDEREAKVQNLPDPGKDAPEWVISVFKDVKALMEKRAAVIRDVRLVEDTENSVQNLLDQCQDVVTKKKRENVEEVQELRQLDGLIQTGKQNAATARSKAQDTLRKLVEIDRTTTWVAKQMDQMQADVAWEEHVLQVVGNRQKETRSVWEQQMPALAKETDRAADTFERKTRSVLMDVKGDLHSNDQVLKNLENAQGLAKAEVSSTEKQDRQNRVDLEVLEQKLKRTHDSVEALANRMMRAEKEATFAEYQTRQTEGLEHMSKDYLAHTKRAQLAEREKADKLSQRMQVDTTVLGDRQNVLMSQAGQLENMVNVNQRKQQERIDAVMNR